MSRFSARLLICVGLVILTDVLHAPAEELQNHWHTPPDKWKEPRLWHSPFEKTFEERISVSRVKISSDFKRKVFSPNKAYWYAVNPDHPSDACQSSEGSRCQFHVSAPDVPIHVFNERDYLIRILLKDHYPNFVLTVYWINEHLLYIEVWWGRIVGSCFIFDVEKESIIHKEMVYDGNLPFMQWQGYKNK